MDENESTFSEQKLFGEGEEVRTVIDNINLKLGFNETDSKLTFEDARLIYDYCRYGQALFPTEDSIWCTAFTEEDLKVGG